MATTSQPDYEATSSWVDIAAANGALANVSVLLQNHDDSPAFVVWGGASPTNKSGVALQTYDSISGTAANIWVRGGGRLSITLL